MIRVEVQQPDGSWRTLAAPDTGVLALTGPVPSLTWPDGTTVREAWRAWDDDRLIAERPGRP